MLAKKVFTCQRPGGSTTFILNEVEGLTTSRISKVRGSAVFFLERLVKQNLLMLTT